jgi:hypothetical protein
VESYETAAGRRWKIRYEKPPGPGPAAAGAFFALAIALGVPPAELLNPHGWRVDLGSAANPVHPAFMGHWLAGRVRVEVDPEGDHSSFLVQFPQPETPSKPATMRELHEFFSGAGAEVRQ